MTEGHEGAVPIEEAKEERDALIRDLDRRFDRAMKLKGEDAFGRARRILSRIVHEAPSDWARHDRSLTELSLCTYKDPGLSREFRLREALVILRSNWDLQTVRDLEVLGQAGAIYKRLWRLSGRKEDLERSVSYYRRGHALGVEADNGYTAINAAFTIDQLAWIEEGEAEATGAHPELAATRRGQAWSIRMDIVKSLRREPGQVEDYWLAATLAEAYFGLDHLFEARRWLARAKSVRHEPWQLQSTAEQLTTLLRVSKNAASVSEFERLAGWALIGDFLDGNAPPAETAFLGKVGLALSGGGFRASLFHIGVLARLAELDMLRHVEVISCVSGGSIVGAYYTLELQKILEEKDDHQIRREEYLQLIERVAREFLAGVQTNLRMRVAANFCDNLRMLMGTGYSQTHRLGDLYERQLFSRVDDDKGNRPRSMASLSILPESHVGDFDPKKHNWRRRNKAPTLILNATSLNTGHSWQFTPSWMGESPWSIEDEIDGTERLRRMSYAEAPEAHREMRLGYAVAASSCVPGLFEPLALEGLYPDRTVRLVDGGVFDNQGTEGLLEQDCDVLLVSDASGQLEAKSDPGASLVGVLSRVQTLMMKRIRGSQFSELDNLRKSRRVRGLLYVHLKKDLESDPVDWTGCHEPHADSEFAKPGAHRGMWTSYDVPKNHQRRLSEIRTDLDAFSEREAFALMESGYRMAAHDFAMAVPGVEAQAAPYAWRFHEVSAELEDARDDTMFARLLDVGSQRVFKAWRLFPRLWRLRYAYIGAIGVALAWAWLPFELEITVAKVVLFVGSILAGMVVGSRAMQVVQAKETLRLFIKRLVFATAGFVIAWLHIGLIDPIYLRYGQVETRHKVDS